MTDMFILAAFVTPAMLLVTAAIVLAITTWQDERDMRLARERGEIPPR